MAAFHSELAIRIIDDSAHGGSGRWRLTEPLTYYSDGFGMVVVPEGFESDLASVPPWRRWPMYWAVRAFSLFTGERAE